MRSGREPRFLLVMMVCSALTFSVANVFAGPAWQTAESILSDPTRSESDRARDPGSMPLEVLDWFGVGAGMTVVDYFPFGGYNTQVLSRLLGSSGLVLATRTDYFAEQLEERIATARLENVRIVPRVDDLEPASVDVIVTIRNLHDLYVFLEDEPADEYAGFLRALKPGGILGVVDVRTPSAGADEKTHRINEEFLIGEIVQAGFELVARSEMLSDATDDYSDSRFPNRYKLDRMLLKFRKLATATSSAMGSQEYVKGEDWQPALAPTEVMVLENGYALGGYDPVAYFALGEATVGRGGLSTVWRGATWLFVSREHRESFIADPESFAPQYGGWCAYGASGHGGEGYGAQSRPQDSWSIIDGKLYLNWNPAITERFRRLERELIPAADRQWPTLANAIRAGDRVHWQTPPTATPDSRVLCRPLDDLLAQLLGAAAAGQDFASTAQGNEVATTFVGR